jgi:hypothetical protein
VVGLLGEHTPQRRVVPGRAGDEVVQLVMPGQSEPLGHGLDALRVTRPQQATHIQRRHSAPRVASGYVEEWLKPMVKVRRYIRRQRNSSVSQHADEIGWRTYF